MSLQKKIFTLYLLSTLFIIGIASTILFTITKDGFNELENIIVQRNIIRVHNNIETQLNYLSSKSADWARWDDTYEFIDDLNQDYIDENLLPEAIKSLDINFILYFNTEGKLIYKYAFDLTREKEIEAPEEFLQKIRAINAKFITQKDLKTFYGFVSTTEKFPIIFVAQRILKSNGEGPWKGVLVFARYFDHGLTKEIEKNVTFRTKLINLHEKKADIEKYQKLLPKFGNENIFIERIGQEIIGYTIQFDFEKNPSFIVEVNHPGEIDKQSINTINYMLITIGAICLFIGIIFYLLIKKTVLSRILALNNILKCISTKNYSETKINIKGKDEIANLGEEIHKMLQRLLTSQKDLEKFRLAVENSSDHICITDPEGKIIYTNKAGISLNGYSIQESLGKKPGELWGNQMGKEFYAKMWKKIKKEKQIFESEILNKKKNGAEYTAELTIIPILNEKNDVQFYVGIEKDITEIKQIDKRKTDFISLASHQMRTPLTAIKWIMQLMLSNQSNLTEEQKNFLKDMDKSNERLINMVNSLLEITHLETENKIKLRMESIRIQDLLKEVMDENQKKADLKNIEITLQNRIKEDISIETDRLRMKQIFQNLLDNSIKYSESNSKINIGCFKNQSEIIFYVEDNGIGIPETEQNRVFEKFFRGSNILNIDTDGNGLNLYITNAVIKALDGKIWFESKTNKGTTFYFSLPIKV